MAGEIRGLSVRQAWAWALACAGKTVENRTRPTSYRGLLAIHASKTRPLREDLDSPLILGAIAAKDFEIDEAASGLGVIVAVAELTACHPRYHICNPEGPVTVCTPWSVWGQCHWVLSDVRSIPEPVPSRDALGLWRLPEDVESAVRKQMERVDA